MIAAVALIWAAVVLLAVIVWRRERTPGLKAASLDAVKTAKGLMLRLPLALMAASFLVEIVPVEALSHIIGPQSGMLGMALAAGIGGLLPGGPMTSFPIAIIFQQGGAGMPQLVALIVGWSVFALHRVLAYEAPIMGWRFAALRLLSCLILPLIAGLLTEAVMVAAGLS